MISVKEFGTLPDGRKAQLFVLDNGNASVYISDYGATIVAVNFPDKNGILTDVVLGCPDVLHYSGEIGYLGATVGRHANRIEKGVFCLDDIVYRLAVNNGPNHLHGGQEGFNHKLFSAFVDGEVLKLSYKSIDMEEGYPGNLDFSVSFSLNAKNEFLIVYHAVCDKDTVVNFTNHSYYNLNGAITEKPIYNHYLTVFADAYCDADENGLANGSILPVRDTVMDFRSPTLLDTPLHSGDERLGRVGGGLDHNYVMGFCRRKFKKAAVLYCPDSGIGMECYTDQPGIQVYTANFMNNTVGKGGAIYGKHSAICLETQNFPNATSFPYFPSPILRAGESFDSKTVYRFYIK